MAEMADTERTIWGLMDALRRSEEEVQRTWALLGELEARIAELVTMVAETRSIPAHEMRD